MPFARIIEVESRNSLSNLEHQFILEKGDTHFQEVKFHPP